ncbi:MAG: hypothetical protein OXG15_00295 [Gammaproteobacteria bacterium]|nr:hypothetical protein [Gammaproteobacteria bacterium]
MYPALSQYLLLELALLRCTLMNINRDPKKGAPYQVEQIAPWLRQAMKDGASAEEEVQGTVDVLHQMALVNLRNK